MLNKASVRIISSAGYKSFLPSEFEYYVLHNSHEHTEDRAFKKKADGPLIITYLGNIRFFDQCAKFLMLFGNDDRFFIRFVGAGAQELKVFLGTCQYSNVEFQDQFRSEDTISLLDDCDLIFNLYGNNTPLLDYALSNKLYFAAELQKPILVCPNTHMETISKHYCFGVTVDLDDESAPNRLYHDYHSIHNEEFKQGCQAFLDEVATQNDSTLQTIRSFLAI